ncbi:hypothetical protein [Archangium violaceum]|uniref:hypothetical protein n=1 Tax=Archangium violaceum TaxID=83451 RepID=UPI0036DB6542
MRRESVQAPLHLLFLGLLAACGSIQDTEQDAAARESLGTVKAAMCAGASVSSLTIQNVTTYLGEMAGGGNWAVTYPANAVHLQYYIDGVLQSSDTRDSTTRSGPWSFSQAGVACGSRTFEVRAYATVIYSGGSTVCWNSSPQTLTRTVTEPCPCGNGVCESTENSSSCPQDCPAPVYCGNGTCDWNENGWTCYADCGDPCGGRSTCGDGTCCPDSGICPSGYYCPL